MNFDDVKTWIEVWWRRRAGLQRFLDAQERTYTRALYELKAGRKTTHWVWFIFPQAVGLGYSLNSRVYGLTVEEAIAYWNDPILGRRLLDCTEAVIVWLERGRPLVRILGEIDAIKFRSCMELFAPLAKDEINNPFERALELANKPGKLRRVR